MFCRPTVPDSNSILSSQVEDNSRTRSVAHTRLKVFNDNRSPSKISRRLGTPALKVRAFVKYNNTSSLIRAWIFTRLRNRKYGVIENRFCYEGGSRCGKGEGLFVCFTDQGDEITRCMNLASENKLGNKRRCLTRNMSGKKKRTSSRHFIVNRLILLPWF